MKKTAVSMLAAFVLTAAANTTLAAENTEPAALSITGEASLNWERSKIKGGAEANTSEQTIKLNFSHQLSDSVSLYGRFAYRNFGRDNTDPTIHEFDQYGLKFKTAGGTLTAGSQEATLGMLSGLVDLTEVGRDNLFAGAAWESGTEEEKYHVLVGRVDNKLVGTQDNQKLIGFEASKTFGSWTLAGEYLHASDVPAISSMYGLGLKTTADKWEFAVEGLNSSAKQDSSGILVGITYSPEEKESISATYRHLKANSVVTGLATFDANTKGIELAWNKNLSERWHLELKHEWATTLDTNEKQRIATIETIYSF